MFDRLARHDPAKEQEAINTVNDFTRSKMGEFFTDSSIELATKRYVPVRQTLQFIRAKIRDQKRKKNPRLKRLKTPHLRQRLVIIHPPIPVTNEELDRVPPGGFGTVTVEPLPPGTDLGLPEAETVIRKKLFGF